MRVTNNMLSNRFLKNYTDNLKKLGKTQDELATGKRVRVPSDDPIATSHIMRLKSDIGDIDQYKRNIDDGMAWMSATENAFSNIGENIHRIRELTVYASSEVLSAEDRKIILSEISERKDQILTEANTSYTGRYIFSGQKIQDKPFMESSEIEMEGQYSQHAKTVMRDIQGLGDEAGKDVTLNFEIDGTSYEFDFTTNEGYTTQHLAEAINDGQITEDSGAIIDIDDYNEDGNAQTGFSGIPNIKAYGEGDEATWGGTLGPNDLILVRTDEPNENFKLGWSDIDNGLDLGEGFGEESDLKTFTSRDVVYVGNKGSIEYEYAHGRTMKINNHGDETFKNIFNLINNIEYDLDNNRAESLGETRLAELDIFIERFLMKRGELGGKENRLEAAKNRYEDDGINLKGLLSDNQDADMAEVIMNLKMQESVYRASLSAGARIIQPSLLDFLR